MSEIFFEIDKLAFAFAAVLGVVIVFLWRWKASFPTPRLLVSDLKNLQTRNASWQSRLAQLPHYLQWMALACFLLAFIDPHFQIAKPGNDSTPIPTEGIAIYLLVDQSSSMKEISSAGTAYIQPGSISKIELLKKITADFIKGDAKAGLGGRPNDLIGLVEFARAAHVLVPLTLDHEQVLKKLAKIQVAQNKDQDGTAIGYALFKTVNVIAATKHYAQDLNGSNRPSYDIKSNVIILVTDGFQEPNPADKGKRLRNLDLMEAAEYAKSKDVRIYIVNVDPAIAANEFIPHRHLMERVTALTGGKFFMVNNNTSLDQIYASIDALEKSKLPVQMDLSKDQQPNRYQRLSLYPYLIALGMALLFLATLLKTTALRQVP